MAGHGLILYLLLHDSQWVRGVTFALYLAQLTLLVLEEVGVLEDLEVGIFLFEFMEVIHIELPLERAKVVVFEIAGQHGVAEVLQQLYDEAVAFFGPGDHGVGGGRVDDIVKFQ